MSTNGEKNMSLNHAMIDWIRHRQNILSEKNGQNKLIRLVILVLTGHCRASTRSLSKAMQKNQTKPNNNNTKQNHTQKMNANQCLDFPPFECEATVMAWTIR